MWPTIATSGCSCSPATRAIDDPMRSVVSSANDAASRQIAAAGPSYPDGDGARNSLPRSSGPSAIVCTLTRKSPGKPRSGDT